MSQEACHAKGMVRETPRAGSKQEDAQGRDTEGQGCSSTEPRAAGGLGGVSPSVRIHSLKLRAGSGSGGRSQTRGSRTKLVVRSSASRLSSSRKRRKVK